jgi:hypothetical protein
MFFFLFSFLVFDLEAGAEQEREGRAMGGGREICHAEGSRL